jgi:AcrR family transcriptional regulator
LDEQKSPPTDRRILRTRQALRRALLALMEEKDYSLITVEEITDRADLGRTTFYLHYKDKEDLLLEEFGSLIYAVVEKIASMPLAELQRQPGPQPPILLIFESVTANQAFYRVLLGGEGGLHVRERLRAIFVEAANQLAATRSEVQLLLESSPVRSYFFVNYFSGALLATIVWWLEQDLHPEAEQVATLFQRMIFPGIKEVLGV